MKFSSHIMFWLVLWGVLLLASPLILSTEGQVVRIKAEVASVRSVFGDEKTTELVGEAGNRYKAIFIDTNWLTEENHLYTKGADPSNKLNNLMGDASTKFSHYTNGYFRSFSINVYGLLVRWGIFVHWTIFIFPFLVAAFVDGFVSRKIKFTQFGFISPMAYSFSLHFIVFMLFVPMLYLVAPLPITPYFMPGWALTMGLPIILLVSNTQRLLND